MGTYESVRSVFFSPTGSTRRILRHVAEGLGTPCPEESPLNLPRQREAGVRVLPGELLLVGMPVYAGRVPGLFHGGLPVRGSGDAVCVVTYGNRAYEDALRELVDRTRGAGFRVVGAAAFVAEHSLNGLVATGRPDETDIASIRGFGHRIAQKLRRPESCRAEIAVPGDFPYKAYRPLPFVPELDPERCERCGRCARECPVQTIDAANYRVTDPSRCITCFACVRHCRAGARSLSAPAQAVFDEKMEMLRQRCAVRREGEVFL